MNCTRLTKGLFSKIIFWTLAVRHTHTNTHACTQGNQVHSPVLLLPKGASNKSRHLFSILARFCSSACVCKVKGAALGCWGLLVMPSFPSLLAANSPVSDFRSSVGRLVPQSSNPELTDICSLHMGVQALAELRHMILLEIFFLFLFHGNLLQYAGIDYG